MHGSGLFRTCTVLGDFDVLLREKIIVTPSGVCELLRRGKDFIPLKLDALETLFLWLCEQISFQPYFARLKMRAVFGTCVLLLCPLEITPRFC